MTSYREILDTDLGPLQKLADQWRVTHKDISGLGKRVQGEMLTPLRDKGYWEGVAAPYAWRMIDDIQRQLEDATKVAAAVLGVLDDALGELKSVKTDLEAAVKRFGEQGLYVAGDGAVSTSVVGGVCKVVDKGSDDAKAIQAAQKEINDIVRRGITADQNLAFSLMSDIGLGQWFNGKPQHSNIDTTNTISQEEYALLDRAMHGKSRYPDQSNDNPYDLGFAWVSGLGSRHRDYHDGDEMTELIKSSVSMEQLRADTLAQWNEEGSGEGRVRYSISESGKVGALKKLLFTDLPAIATGDREHLGEAFMGSYSVNYDVKGQDPDGSLVVQYTLNNDTSNESFLHFVGYYDWLEKTNKKDGTFSTVSQTITWTERIPAGTK
ncbi:hypothetical protein EDE04_7391 [Streptomyces sp. 2132.2]|uniref:hypothetical protein n=1 Tax=Streptomyces sp. 2132.2 TaxID=2485161 RepID=UPI000F4A5417|nr:hypothetical protein [Streptomyces sp. 2132.2]ROQ88996.1 hypothetical protein EDE04_7391 [Streptomyces sp. 2132.2]